LRVYTDKTTLTLILDSEGYSRKFDWQISERVTRTALGFFDRSSDAQSLRDQWDVVFSPDNIVLYEALILYEEINGQAWHAMETPDKKRSYIEGLLEPLVDRVDAEEVGEIIETCMPLSKHNSALYLMHEIREYMTQGVLEYDDVATQFSRYNAPWRLEQGAKIREIAENPALRDALLKELVEYDRPYDGDIQLNTEAQARAESMLHAYRREIAGLFEALDIPVIVSADRRGGIRTVSSSGGGLGTTLDEAGGQACVQTLVLARDILIQDDNRARTGMAQNENAAIFLEEIVHMLDRVVMGTGIPFSVSSEWMNAYQHDMSTLPEDGRKMFNFLGMKANSGIFNPNERDFQDSAAEALADIVVMEYMIEHNRGYFDRCFPELVDLTTPQAMAEIFPNMVRAFQGQHEGSFMSLVEANLIDITRRIEGPPCLDSAIDHEAGRNLRGICD